MGCGQVKQEKRTEQKKGIRIAAKQNSNFSFKVTKIKTKNHTKKTVNLYQTFYQIFFFSPLICFYKIHFTKFRIFHYLSSLISIKLGLQLQKRVKEAGRDSFRSQSCQMNTACENLQYVYYMYYYRYDNWEGGGFSEEFASTVIQGSMRVRMSSRRH